MSATSVRWVLFATIGLLVAVAVALLATHMVSEKIGITGEPVNAGESLVPKHPEHKAGVGRRHRDRTRTETSTSGAVSPAAGMGSGSSGETDGGEAESKPKRSSGNLAPPSRTPGSGPASPAPSGGSGTSTELEPGDD